MFCVMSYVTSGAMSHITPVVMCDALAPIVNGWGFFVCLLVVMQQINPKAQK